MAQQNQMSMPYFELDLNGTRIIGTLRHNSLKGYYVALGNGDYHHEFCDLLFSALQKEVGVFPPFLQKQRREHWPYAEDEAQIQQQIEFIYKHLKGLKSKLKQLGVSEENINRILDANRG